MQIQLAPGICLLRFGVRNPTEEKITPHSYRGVNWVVKWIKQESPWSWVSESSHATGW